MKIIAPSILASDWGKLSEEITAVEKAGADWLHLDVMDGQFVPPITFGPKLVKASKDASSLPIDVHLMIVEPENHIADFAKAGADYISVHQETCPHLHRIVQSIKELGVKAGVALNPATPLETVLPVIEEIDLLLLMSVNPGWGGQAFIQSTAKKLDEAKDLINKYKPEIKLEVDGGINAETAKLAKSADVLVAGTYVFGSKDYKGAIAAIK